MDCCVCLETITYYSYHLNCKHDLCEKCAYQMFDTNSKCNRIIQKYGMSCYLSCPLCRTDCILKINSRNVCYFDNLIKLSSISSTMEYIDKLYNSKQDKVPYIFIMYPDGYAFILDPITKYIYDAYNEKYRIGIMKTRKIVTEDNTFKLQTWIRFYYPCYVYLYDLFYCGKSRLRFN